MLKNLISFRKEDMLMWGGVAVFSLVIFLAISVFSDSARMVSKDLIGLAVVILLPGYTIVKLYLDNFQVSENLTKNPDTNKAIDKLILSFGTGVCAVIPLNFLWNYLLTMGMISESGNIVGNVDEEMIYTGSATWRSLMTVVLIIAIAVGIKLYQLKKGQGDKGLGNA